MSATIKNWAFAALILSGCAPAIPKELLNARTAYRELTNGQATHYAPNEVAEAKRSLSSAEDSYIATGPSQQTRALSIEAEQKAIAAQATCAVALIPENMLLFEFGKAELLPEAQEKLDKVVSDLKETGAEHVVFTIEGHTDAIGTQQYNLALSERRAAAVRDHLVAAGIDPAMFQVVGKGKEDPIGNNATSEGRANNRRVEILVGEKKSGE